MAKIYKNAAELVGNTPLLEVGNLEKELGLEARILVKLEYFNPAGSAKDRIALRIHSRWLHPPKRKRYFLPPYESFRSLYFSGQSAHFHKSSP